MRKKSPVNKRCALFWSILLLLVWGFACEKKPPPKMSEPPPIVRAGMLKPPQSDPTPTVVPSPDDKRKLVTIRNGPTIYVGDLRRAMLTDPAVGVDWDENPVAAQQTLDRLIDEALMTLSARRALPDFTGNDWERIEAWREQLCAGATIDDQRIVQAFKKDKKRFARSPQARLYQILFSLPESASKAKTRAVERYAQKTLDDLKSRRSNVFELSKQFSKWDNKSEPVHGGLGYFMRGILPLEIAETMFSDDHKAPRGRLVSVRSQLGFHVLMIGDEWPGRAYDLQDVTALLRDELLEQDCRDKLRERLNALRAQRVVRHGELPAPKTPPARPPVVPGMIYLQGGRFAIGSTPEEIDARRAACDELVGPVVDGCRREWFADEWYEETYVAPFYLDEYEVTVAEFFGFLRSTNRRIEDRFAFDDQNPNEARLPIRNVNRIEAKAYCAWAGKRLPSFAQWQYAARGKERRRFAWGNQPPNGTQANYCDALCDRPWRDPDHEDGFAGPAPVGSYPAGRTPQGIWDMGGNVREWTSDQDADGMAFIPGGGWWNARDDLWAADVRTASPWMHFDMMGFRCAKELPK